MEPRVRVAAVLGTCAVGVGVAAIWSATATSCSETPEAASPVASASATADDGCALTLGPSSFEPEPPPPRRRPPTSRIGVELALSEATLARAIDTRVPKGLGSAKRKPIGAPGEVTYSVSRGVPKVALVGEVLEVTIPIHAAVEICKPIGRLCPTYGSCQPNLVATTRVPLRLEEDYGVATPKVDVRVTRGCRIAGFDVTDEVQSAASGARRTAERQIADAIPDVRALLEDAMRKLERPVRVDDGHCLRVTPRAIRQGKPRSEDGTLVTAIEVEGNLEPASCDARYEAPALPPLTPLEGASPTSELVTLRPLDGDALASALWASKEGDVEVGVRRAVAHRTAEGPRLALELALDGRVCGELWASSNPTIVDDVLLAGPLSPVEMKTDVLDGVELRAIEMGADDLGPRLVDELKGAMPTEAIDGLPPPILEAEVTSTSANLSLDGTGIAIRSTSRGRLRIVVPAPGPG